MNNKIFQIVAFAFVVVLFLCCNNSATNNTAKETEVEYVGNSVSGNLEWCNALIQDYVSRSTDELIVLERKDTSVHFEWYLDRAEEQFGKRYLIFHLGHDVGDEGNSNVRFVTDGWLYIDSLSRRLYVYDFAQDTIVAWE